jgi:uncharacterized membrane protein
MSLVNKLRQPHVWVLLGILVLAAFLRLYKIDAQSLWYDEGNSARIAERSLQLIVEGAAGDIHPPLYYIVLKYWRALFGEGEAALRSLSALAGVLTVWFAYGMGRDLFRRRVGLIAAFLYAVMPFAVYYGQEARMYALLALCAAASTWALLRFSIFDFVPDPIHRSDVRNGDHGRFLIERVTLLVLYVIATAAGLWTQYAYPFVMVAQGVCVLLFVASRDAGAAIQNPKSKIRNLIAYAIASAIALVLYAVWVPIAVRQVLGWRVDAPAYDLAPALLDAWRTLVVGRTLPLEQAVLPLILFSALMLIGLIAPNAERKTQSESTLVSRICLTILAFLPLALLFVFGLYRDAYLKFLLVCVLPMCVLAARGIDVICNWLFVMSNDVTRRRLPITIYPLLITLAFALLLLPSLNNLYNNPAFARDDYRGIQRAIAANARPDDAVIFIAPNQWEVFTYYQRDDRNLFPVTYKPATYDDAAQQMEQIAANHERLFVLFFAERDADPEGWYESWLAGATYKAHEQWTGNIRWAVYSSGKGDWSPAQMPNARFGDAITLTQVKMRNNAASAGDVLPFELTWQTNAPIDKRYKVFIHIGPADAPPIAQNDSEPSAGFMPTNAWRAGQPVTDRRGVWINAGETGDALGVFVGIYDPDTGQRLPITVNGQPAGDRLQIGTITIK